MTTRPVYTAKNSRPWYRKEDVDIEWNAGQSAIQKKKNSKAIHEAYLKRHPDAKILEVSTKADSELGQALSPFNLTRTIGSLKKEFPVENIYQASKVFTQGGPYVDLLGTEPGKALKDARLENSGRQVHFLMENEQYPVSPNILFYNWLYIQALMEHPGLMRQMKDFDSFTDVEFNPAKGSNNQARACAIYTSLAKAGLLEKTRDFESFKKLFFDEDISEMEEQHREARTEKNFSERINALPRRRTFAVGQWLEHPGIGKGEVIRKTRDGYLINFKVAGPRTISKDYVEHFCTPITSV